MCSLSIQAATLFLTLATASLFSASSAAPSTTPNDITTVAASTAPDRLSIHFNASCPGCFEDPDDELELILEIDTADEECSTIAPRLNGLPLVASNYGDGVASGQVFLSQPSGGSGQRDVQASWESTCLNGEASIVSVRLEGIIDQGPLDSSSGFTASFKQKGQPTLLRLQDKPVGQLSQALCDDWIVPDVLSIIPVVSDSPSSVDTMLQVEYAKLAELQAEMEVLHARAHSILKSIMSLLKKKFTACSSMQCVWNTAVEEMSPIARLIVSHFQHHKGLARGCREGDTQSPCSANDELDGVYLAQDASASPTPVISTAQPSLSGQPTTRDAPSTSPTNHVHYASTSTNYVQYASTSTNHVQYASSTAPAPYTATTAGSHYGFSPAGPYDAQFALNRKLALAIVALVLLVILSGLVIRAVLRYRDPRRRAERAARWEERRTRRLYRKAACKHKWRTFWKNLCARRQRSDEYEEKGNVVSEQVESLVDDDGGLQKEIRTMRNASTFVRDLVQAEEGRSRNVHQSRHNPDGFEPAELNGSIGSSASSDVAPSYKTDRTPPPGYDAELEGEMVIVDEFRYTPSVTDDTPESSIVDCSPRLSLDTGRSTILTKDTQD